jgi:hypothetical protein
METKNSKGKRVKSTVFAATMIIGASTVAFQVLTQAVMAAEYNKANTIPTTYVSYANQPSGTSSVPEGYKKANYTVKDIDLAYYKNQTPTSKDMSKKDAVEIGAQALWSVYGLDLEGQVIEMGYQPATDSLPRSSWHGDVLIDGKLCYDFDADSVTGELFGVSHSRTLDKNVSVAYDAGLAKNPQEYAAFAKETAEKLNVVHSLVTSVDYNCQGYSNNDPDITFVIKGENGELASMTFSRYDKALLGISYNAEYQYTLKYMKQLEQQSQEAAEQRQNSASKNGGNQAPSLVITPDN